MITTQKLGALRKLEDIREIWPYEDRNFTGWLAREENIALLSEALGMGPEGLEVLSTEQNIGGFRADIVCQETDPTGRMVVIENQYGQSDHDHLGKLLTYAAGQKARILVWIVEKLREEHEAAIDLLNDISSDDFQAFGVEIELWRINDSLPAPRFNVIAKPNDWVREERKPKVSRSDSPLKNLRLEYWTAFREALRGKNPPFNPVSPKPASWISHGLGKSGFGLNMGMNTKTNWVRVEVYINGPLAQQNYAFLKDKAEDIENDLEIELDWQDLSGNDRRICVVLDANPKDKKDWPRQHEWLAQTAIKFYNVFHPIVRELDRETGELVS